MRRRTFYGLRCPTGGEAHGPLLSPRPGASEGRYLCTHEEHHRVSLREPDGATQASWTLEELQAAGVAP